MRSVTQARVTLPALPKTGLGSRPGIRERVIARQVSAIRLRTAGASFRQIGEQLGTSAMQAHRDVTAALAEVVAQRNEDAAALRALELERLDRLTTAVWPKAQRGDCEAVRACVRISERRSRLCGLDAAVAQKLELAGQPVIVAATTQLQLQLGAELAALSDEQLAERAQRVMETLRLPPAQEPPAPVPVETALDRAMAEYSRVLAERAAGSSAGGHGRC